MDNNDKHILLTPDELLELMKRAVSEALIRFGIDTEHPIQVQRDLQFVRDWRTTAESVKGKTILAAVGIMVVGILGLVWLGMKSIIYR